MSPAAPDDLEEVLGALDDWSRDDSPLVLHSGDVGWHARLGVPVTREALRTWRDGDRLVAVGLLDGERVLRLALAPEVQGDESFAERLAADVAEPRVGVLPAGAVDVEARGAPLLGPLLRERGWEDGDPWTSLGRDLAEPVEEPGLEVETVAPERGEAWLAVHGAAFGGSARATERWRALTSGPAATRARFLLLHDDGTAVASAGVWSAGPGRAGVLEPLGVHPDHRGRGHGRRVALAAAAALHELGASSAAVATPSANTGAVATYRAAGFRDLGEVRDLHRP